MWNNLSTLMYGNEGGRGPATSAYAIIASRPAGSMMQWMQCTRAQSPRNALRVGEILKGLSSYLSTGRLYSKSSWISIRNGLE